MANKTKTYSIETTSSVVSIGKALHALHVSSKIPLKALSASSGLSVNSIKSIFGGATANIASYDSLARALGSSLIDVASGLKAQEGQKVAETAKFQPETASQV